MINRKRRKSPPFVMLEKSTIRSKEWQELSGSAKSIYIYIKANYNGGNNGEISFKYREAENDMAPATISKALKELINKEWIEKTKHGGLFRYHNLFKLTSKHDRIR